MRLNVLFATIVAIALLWGFGQPIPSVGSPSLPESLPQSCATSSLAPTSVNYFESAAQCTTGSRMTVANQLEADFGQSCAGPNSQSQPINAGGPLALDIGSVDGSSVVMTQDYVTHATSCQTPQFSWFSYADHIEHGGAPLPADVFAAQTTLTLNYDDYISPGAGGTRLWVQLSGWWGGGFNQIEINLSQTNWPRASSDPEIVLYRADQRYTDIDGCAIGLCVSPGRTQTVVVNWGAVLRELLRKGDVASPFGVGQSAPVIGAVGVGTEVLLMSASGVSSSLHFVRFDTASREQTGATLGSVRDIAPIDQTVTPVRSSGSAIVP